MDTLLSFGDYAFSGENQIECQDNFASCQGQSHALPGRDGALMAYGDARSPTPLGNVRAPMWIYAGRKGMHTRLDDIRRLSRLGLQKLVMQPSGELGDTRFCMAIMRNADIPQRARDRSQNHQRVTLIFDVPLPVWLSETRTQTISASGISTPFSLEVRGNVETSPILRITTSAGQTAGGVHVVRLDGVDEVQRARYHSALPAQSNLYIDCASRQVRLNGADAYGSAFSHLTGDWLTLLPGQTNNLSVRMQNAGDDCTLSISWQDRWA